MSPQEAPVSPSALDNDTPITLETYQPGTALDTELAAVAYAAVRGWPDQRPITPDLVASWLTAPTASSTTPVALARHDGRLIGWAGLRPPPRGGTGRLWGPAVHPDQQCRGLGRRLLDEIMRTPDYARCRNRITTEEIPAGRTAARALFTGAGWSRCGGATLLRAYPAPAPPAEPDHRQSQLRVVALPEMTGAFVQLVRLYAATYPRHGADAALTVLSRWAADHRYSPDHVLFACDERGMASGALLLYPLSHTDPVEPAEVLIAELLVDIDRVCHEEVVDALLAAALRTAGPERAVRVITTDPHIVQRMIDSGLTVLDDLDYYCPSAYHHRTPAAGPATVGNTVIL